jgi:polar amino acid transport system substrate-binding protein
MLRLFAALAIAVLVSGPGLAADKTLNLAATEYPPFYGKELKDHGFITEIIATAFERSGYQIDVKFLPWKRALEKTKDGAYDGLFTVWYREEREQWFVYSDPLPANEIGFYKRVADEISFTNYQDLQPYRIGVVRGYVNPPGFDEAELKTIVVVDDETNFRKLAKGRIDLVLTDRLVGQNVINTVLAGSGVAFEWVTPALTIETQHLVFSKQVDGYEQRSLDFNTGLAAIEADGTLAAIMKKHGFSTD